MRNIGNLEVSGSLNISGSAIIVGTVSASSFIGDGSQLSGVTSYTNSDTLSYINSLNVVSSSAQLSTEISGAFVSTSASLSSRTSTLEQFSSSLDTTFATDSELSTVSSSLASDISSNDSRLTTIEGKTLVSSSAQISTEISGAFFSTSASLASDISTNDSRLTTLEGKTLVSGSSQINFGSISNKPTLVSGSSQIVYNQVSNIPSGIISSSAQLSDSTIPGNLTVGGILTAQEFHTEFVSASIIYDSGSTQFGNSLDDIHNFSGSLAVNTDNLFVSGGNVGIGTSTPSAKLEVAGGSNAVGNTNLKISSDIYPWIDFYSANTNTNNRNWRIAGVSSAYGTFEILNSSAANGIPDQPRFVITKGGAVGIGNNSPTEYGSSYVNLWLGSTEKTGYLTVYNGTVNLELNADNQGVVRTRSNHPLLFGTNETERMRITSTGNVGIGTTGPGQKLQVDNGYILARPIQNVSTAEFFIGGGTTQTGNTPMVGIGIVVQDVGNNGYGMTFSTQQNYITGVAEKMRLTNTGRLGIATTSPSYTLHVNGSVAGVGAYVNLSDIDYKKNIYDLTDGLDKVLQLRPVTFNWKNEDYGDRINTGFIAQEVEDVLPNSVITAEDSVKSIATSELIAVLTKAIQEQQAIIETQNSRIIELETALQALIIRVEQLENQ